MASDYLLHLRKLRAHYETLGDMAAKGDWNAVTTEARSGERLFLAFKSCPSADLQAEERAEATQLLKEILEADRQLKFTTSAWLDDARPLIAAFNNSR